MTIGRGDAGRREIVVTVVRILVTAGAVLAAYYLVPVHDEGAGWAWVRFGGGIAIFLATLGLEVRAILRARHPYLRAAAAISLVLPVFLVFFAWTYLNLSLADPAAAFSMELSRTRALYFTVTVFSTVGFGDIVPGTDPVRALVAFQELADLAFVVAIARLIFHAASVGVERRNDAPAEGDSSAPADPF
jgi:voltage-gated potassium channel